MDRFISVLLGTSNTLPWLPLFLRGLGLLQIGYHIRGGQENVANTVCEVERISSSESPPLWYYTSTLLLFTLVLEQLLLEQDSTSCGASYPVPFQSGGD